MEPLTEDKDAIGSGGLRGASRRMEPEVAGSSPSLPLGTAAERIRATVDRLRSALKTAGVQES